MSVAPEGNAPGMVWKNGRYVPKQTTTPKRRLTPAQRANRQVKSMIDAQIQAIEDAKTQYLFEQKTLQQQSMRRAQDAYRFLGGMGTAGNIAGAYDGAADQVQGTAGGFGKAINTGADAAAAVDDRILSGTGQQARNEGDAMGEVFSHAYGTVPGSALHKIGSAYAADASGEPARYLQEGILNALREYQPDTSDFYDQIAEIRGSAPELRLKMIERLQDMQDAKLERKWAIQDRKQDRKDAKWERKMDIAEAKRDALVEQAKLAAAAGDDARSDAYLRLAQERYNLSVWKAQQDAANDAKGGGLTPNARAENLQKVLALEEDLAALVPSLVSRFSPKGPKASGILGGLQAKTTNATNPKVRRRVASELWKRYRAYALTPEAKKALRATISRVVNDGGGGGAGDDFWEAAH